MGVPRSKKKRFSETSPGQRRLLVGVTALSLGLVAAAERDIHRRPSERIRGSKPLWRVASTNAIGATCYLRWGRLAA